jgi:hypothetical protein
MTGNYFKCCICGFTTYGYGNNPNPIKEKGKCCDDCNADHVLPVRIELFKIKKKYGKDEKHIHSNEE